MNEMNEPKKISYRSLTEKMSDEELKHIIAGSGGPGNWEECCECTWTANCPEGYFKGSGTVCGDYGDTNCLWGAAKLRSQLILTYWNCSLDVNCLNN